MVQIKIIGNKWRGDEASELVKYLSMSVKVKSSPFPAFELLNSFSTIILKHISILWAHV